MDGVVADFNGAAQAILQASDQDRIRAEQDGRWRPHEWQQLIRLHPDLYRILPKMPRADSMIDWARRFRDQLGWQLNMLTALPKDKTVTRAAEDKIAWMAEHYPDISVCFGPYSQDKWRHCRPGDILVDDRADNCRSWTHAGGLAIRVYGQRHYNQALDQLATVFVTLAHPGPVNHSQGENWDWLVAGN